MKKALIVGINDYPSSPLNGCVNAANLNRRGDSGSCMTKGGREYGHQG